MGCGSSKNIHLAKSDNAYYVKTVHTLSQQSTVLNNVSRHDFTDSLCHDPHKIIPSNKNETSLKKQQSSNLHTSEHRQDLYPTASNTKIMKSLKSCNLPVDKSHRRFFKDYPLVQSLKLKLKLPFSSNNFSQSFTGHDIICEPNRLLSKPKYYPESLPYSKELCAIQHKILRTEPIENFYEILEVLGRGSFGEVRRGVNKITQEQVAIKIMKKKSENTSASRDANLRKMFYSEIFNLSSISHPNIVQFKDAFKTPLYYYTVLELCDSGDLHNYITHSVRIQQKKQFILKHLYINENSSINLNQYLNDYNGLNETEVIQLVIAMLQPIHYLHSNNYVHRDIKIQNFLFSSNLRNSKAYIQKRNRKNKENKANNNMGEKATRTHMEPSYSDTCNVNNINLSNLKHPHHLRLVLIDFGMSFLMQPGKPLTRICGTPHYVAPEILTCNYGSEVDMWALGVIVYLILYGRYPFEGSSSEIIFSKIKNDTVVFPITSYGPSFWALDFTQRCLRKSPKERMTATEALEHPWLQSNVIQESCRYPIIMTY